MAGPAPHALRGRRLTRTRPPAVSVLLPVRDGAEHLPEAIASLEAQSLASFEVVAVDDGSRDSSAEILRAWARRDRRVVVLGGSRRGIARALGTALEAARAPLVARMDADDVSLPDRFRRQLEVLEASPELAALGTRVRMFPRGSLTEGMRRYERWLAGLVTPEEVLADLFVESPLVHPSVMARRDALLAVGGYRDVDGPEDYDLWLRLARAGRAMAALPETLLLWRDRPGRATRVDPRYRAEAIARLKARHLIEWRLGGAREVGVWGAGALGKGWGRRLARRGVVVAFFVDIDPRKVGQRVHGAPVLDPDRLPAPGGPPVLVAVGAPGARELIREALRARGYREPEQVVTLQ